MYICNLHNVYSFNFALVCFMLGIMFSEFSVVLIQFYRYIIVVYSVEVLHTYVTM